jgi:predicted Zn-dependent peptidase
MFVRHDAFALPGMFVMGTSIDHLLAGKALTSAREIVQSLVTTPVSPSEFEQARAELVSLMNKELARPDGTAEVWLDIDTYGLSAATEQLRVLGDTTPADLRRAATRLFRDDAFASVVVGNSELVKTQIERHVKVEIMGTVDARVEPKADQKTTKPTPDLGAKPE